MMNCTWTKSRQISLWENYWIPSSVAKHSQNTCKSRWAMNMSSSSTNHANHASWFSVSTRLKLMQHYSFLSCDYMLASLSLSDHEQNRWAAFSWKKGEFFRENLVHFWALFNKTVNWQRKTLAKSQELNSVI